ncbi:hypothetical protein JOL62DRAFT_115907 [Phyllosticta paracitricarpa]|uniref:Uncharacterized protein n=1 Tax=Phyllosticta paracitricarpa TaxID=2016321 RepID=A0ABR1N7N3_9PEZI
MVVFLSSPPGRTCKELRILQGCTWARITNADSGTWIKVVLRPARVVGDDTFLSALAQHFQSSTITVTSNAQDTESHHTPQSLSFATTSLATNSWHVMTSATGVQETACSARKNADVSQAHGRTWAVSRPQDPTPRGERASNSVRMCKKYRDPIQSKMGPRQPGSSAPPGNKEKVEASRLEAGKFGRAGKPSHEGIGKGEGGRRPLWRSDDR